MLYRASSQWRTDHFVYVSTDTDIPGEQDSETTH